MYEREDPRVLGALSLGTLFMSHEQDLDANVVQRATPTIRIREGADKFARWMRLADICEWHLIVALDLHNTIDKKSLDHCADLYHRLRTMPNVKIIINTFLEHQENAGVVLAHRKAWQWLVERVDGIVIVTDTVRERGIERDGVTVTTWPLEHPKVICLNGGKGDILGISGVPGVLVDDKLQNLLHWMDRGKAPSAGILVPGYDWESLAWGRGRLPQDIVMLAHHQAWVLVIRTFYCQSTRMGWADRSKAMAARREHERMSLDVHTLPRDGDISGRGTGGQPETGGQPQTDRGVWKEYTDPEGRTYYHNAATNESTWTLPQDAQPDQSPSPAQVVQPDAQPDQPGAYLALAALTGAADEDDWNATEYTSTKDMDTDTTDTDISMLRPTTATDLVPLEQDMWSIACEVDRASGQLWPTYRHPITGPQWIRPDAVPIARAAADFEGALVVWRGQTHPEEVAKVEKAGIVRNFTWGTLQHWQ